MNESGFQETTPRPYLLPAWAMSLLFHMAVIVTLALTLHPAAPAPPGEPERSVGIVLARRDAQDERVYFEEDSPAEAPGASEPAATSIPSVEQALPEATKAPPLEASLALPAAEGALATPESALAQVALAGQGRPLLYDGAGEDAIIAADRARQRGQGGPSGPPTRVSLFGSAPISGRSFAFVLDRSQSMGGAGLGVLAAAEGELERALASLQVHHKFQIVAYNKTPLTFHPAGMAPGDEATKQRAVAFVRDLAALGGTGHYLALATALRMDPDVVFLLTDGGDPRLTTPEIDEISRRAAGVRIICLQFGFGPAPDDSSAMRILAERTRGDYFYIDMSRHR